jgi:protein-export membrane protein SecD
MNKYNNPTNKGQVTMNKVRMTFVFIIVLTALATLVIIPRVGGLNWFNKFKIHLGLDLQGGTHLVYRADTSSVVDESDIDSRLEALRDIIEYRVNFYGVSEPVVQTNFSGGEHRIIVELAGIKDTQEAINRIGETPQLDFRIQGEPIEPDEGVVEETIIKANEILARALAGEDFAQLASEYSEDLASAVQGGDLGWAKKNPEVPELVPEFGKAIFEDLEDGEISPEIIESQFGYHIIKRIEDRLNDQGEIEVHAAHILFKGPNNDIGDYNWIPSGLTGEHVKQAQFSVNQTTQEPLVLLNFSDEGKEMFAQLTTDHVGEPIAIFLDDGLLSSPVVQEPIKDGRAQISGSFTLQSAKDLVDDLNLGALPIPIELISQTTVGASLGEASVQKSLLAGIIGLIAAALFMLLFYRLPGLISVFALAIYTVVTLALFEMIPVTMTLAGVAGFILSIGMAVDANILIFERTKEELYNGRSLNTAIENGFMRAWTSIRDSNISSIITCLILAWFGTSIIKGFAITLGIGILISMFSAITVTRTFLRLMVNKKLENKLGLFGIKK